ncbi:ABC transporter permease [Cryptosporangium aurantiacum]|uniref:Peptide/nickel transport system permease protein n=1 Tax=Cryptosporangium aurantiacum TaxID=134849 RepID=A0A1M7NMU1_9ACTN|nr:ABC transporter permease [Cryptosporangium aurantiacum]SHN04659.1 peptide/nickel transport system permease protein [Cryptosporangium aurantiacum]
MLRYVVRRLLGVIPTLFVLSFLLYAWLRSLPGGPATALLGDKATPEKIASLNRTLGLDEPIWVQYGKFLGRVFTGDFGSSLASSRPVVDELGDALPATIELSVAALLFAIVLGIPLGYLSAKRRGGFFDNATVIATLVGVAVPVFFLGYILKQWFAVDLGWLPPSGRITAGLDQTEVTGFLILDGILTREWDVVWDAIQHLILPAITLGTIPLAVIVRITRASVLDVLNEDYVRTAEAKGLRARTIRSRHVLRNGLLPVSTTIGLQAGLLLAGAVLTEKVFVWGGIGSLLAEGIEKRDYPRLQALILVAALTYVLVNLLVDLSYALIDPRVRVR